ncbi:PAS domain-containing protein [Leptolyngbya sp. CCNP1308]|uniref:PAS domain-containing protein n=1 Tax=Leptolyngbya sp. CCNP1308 TaxID=3110255 RepID=UPI002B20D746|nr:PAS domain-containing protein [Leptolyngbya sp. CCNP1308]MEA5452446.1 PAS domain-containing protein [Leptolyngbya sp. CCNP1308]
MRHDFVDITASVGSITSVSDVVRLMGDSQPQLSCIFVVDGENLVGSFAEGALLALVAQGRSLAELTMAEVMQAPVISVRQSDLSDISIPAGLLQQHATDCLAVVDEQGALAGVITRESLQPYLWQMFQAQQVELTHQQELATSLSQGAAQYQSLLQALPDLVIRTSAEGVYLDRVGSADFELYRDNADLVGKRGDEILPAELAAQRLTYIQQALRTGELQIYDQQIVINDTLRTEEVRINVCGDNEVLVIVRDITDRKTLEDTNRAILEAIPDLMVRVNRRGQYIGILRGDSVKRVLLPPPDFYNYTIYDVLPSTLAKQKVQMAQQALDTGTVQIYEQQIEIDGDLCWEEVRVSPVNPDEVLFMIRDISERKRSEAERQQAALALAQSEATQRAILAAIPDLLVRVSAEGRYLDFIGPDRSFNLFDPALVTPDGSILDLLPPELAHPQLAAIRRSLETRELQVHEQQIQVSGRVRHEELRAVAIGDHEVLLMIRDISDRKQAEERLCQSEAQSRAILSAIPDLMFRTTADGVYLEYIASRRVTDLLPSTVNSVGQSMVDLLPPEVAQRHLAAIRQALDTRTLQVYEQQIQIGDRTQYEEVRAIASGDNEVLFMIRDISDRKQAEIDLQALNHELEARVAERTAALQESEERWQLALQGSDASLWDWNIKTGEVFRTRRWHELRGLAEDTVSGTPEEWSDRIHPDDRDRVLAAMADHLAQKTAFYQQEYRLRHEAGHYLWILDRGQAVWDEAGNPTRIIGSEMDITQRKQAELEAQTLKRQLEFVLSSSPAAIFTCQLDGATTFMSDNIVNVSGYTSAEFLSRPDFWTIHLHPEDAPRLLAELPILFEQGQHIHEYRFLHKAGHYIWIRNELRLILDAQGAPVEIVGYFADIGDRKAIENQLRKSQAALSEAQRMVHLGSWEVDVATSKLTWSEELFYIFGFDPSDPEPAYAEHFDFIHPEDRGRLEEYVDLAMREGNPYELELRILRVDGTVRYLDARGEAKRDDQGQITKIFGTALDITERKVAELERQNLSNRLTLALSSGAIGCWDWDIQQNTIFWDERMYELYGAAAADIAASVPYEIWANSVHPDDRAATETLLQQAILGQAIYDPEFRVIHGDGSIHHIKAHGMVVLDAEGNPKSMIGVNLDISDRKRSEAERQQAEDRLQQINERLMLTNAELDRATRLKDEFLANMSHELRTPLNAILGMSEGLKEHVFGSLSDRQRQAVETIERSGTHLLDLINDILDLSKIEAGKLELETALVSVQYLCESSLTFVRQLALSKDVGLSLEIAQAIPDIVVDERRIRQVLINLLSNAVKFTPSGGQVTLQARVEQQNGRNHLKLSVTDTGIGIAPDDIAKLFQPFVQIDSSLSRQYNGTGLGLALVRKMAELHGGTVSVTSEVNQGSCFTLNLPYLTDIALPAIAPTPQRSLLDTHNCRVLVIEDSAAAADLIARYLEEQGMEAIICPSGDRVMGDVIKFHPALIILDILLPNLSGWEVLRHLKTDPKTLAIPVIVVSVVDERSYGLSLGASEYLVKPISRYQLQQAIESLQHRPQPSLSPVPVVPSPNSSQPAIEMPLILLAEDNDMNVATVSSYLTALGYRLLYAKNGRAAVELAQTQAPDLILMDIQMPDMDGLQAMQLVRSDARCANIPIVALTALVMPGDRERCLAAGASHYLSKPFKMKALKGLIQQLLQLA